MTDKFIVYVFLSKEAEQYIVQYLVQYLGALYCFTSLVILRKPAKIPVKTRIPKIRLGRNETPNPEHLSLV